jgi:hypothetical protein
VLEDIFHALERIGCARQQHDKGPSRDGDDVQGKAERIRPHCPVCDALQSKNFSRGPCNVQTRSWSRRSHSVTQLLPRFLENLLCFGEFVEQLIG